MFSVLITIVVLLAAGILLVALFYKDPISRQKLAIEETESPEKKADLIRKFQTANNFIISRLERILLAIRNAFQGVIPEIDYDRHHKAEIISRLVVVGILLDWLLQWLVNQRMTVLSPLMWVIPSLLMALLISWFTELSAFSLTNDPARRARGERLCRNGMIVTGILSVTCLLIFFYGRTVQAKSVNDWIIAVISGSLWIVAEGLGVACGFAAAWARHIDRDGRAADKYHRIEEKLQPRYEFREWLEEQEIRLKTRLPTTVLLLFLAVSLPVLVLAQTTVPDLTILIDGTASVDQERLREALAKLRESVPALARIYGRVKIGIFSNEGPFTKIATISIPSLASVKDCSGQTSGTKIARQDLTGLFPGIREYQEIQKTKKCNAENSAVEQKNREDLAVAIKNIQTAIPESLQPKSGCTGIVSLLQSALANVKPKSTLLLISDGEETCSQEALSGIKIPAGTKAFLFLVPKAGPIEKEGPEAIKRGEFWQASVPGIAVRPYTDMSEMVGKLR